MKEINYRLEGFRVKHGLGIGVTVVGVGLFIFGLIDSPIFTFIGVPITFLGFAMLYNSFKQNKQINFLMDTYQQKPHLVVEMIEKNINDLRNAAKRDLRKAERTMNPHEKADEYGDAQRKNLKADRWQEVIELIEEHYG